MEKTTPLLRNIASATQQLRIPANLSKEIAAPQPLPNEFLAIIRESRLRSDRSVLRCKAAAAKAGFGVSTLWRDCKDKVFPQPIRISKSSVAWVDAEIDAILSAKALMSRTNQTISLKLFVAMLTAPRES